MSNVLAAADSNAAKSALRRFFRGAPHVSAIRTMVNNPPKSEPGDGADED